MGLSAYSRTEFSANGQFEPKLHQNSIIFSTLVSLRKFSGELLWKHSDLAPTFQIVSECNKFWNSLKILILSKVLNYTLFATNFDYFHLVSLKAMGHGLELNMSWLSAHVSPCAMLQGLPPAGHCSPKHS